MKKNTVFILRAHELESQVYNCNLPKIKKDTTINVYNHDLGIFTSRENAEKMIVKWLDHVKMWNLLILGFTLTEKAVDENFGGRFSEICEFESRRSYDKNGKFLCDSLYDDGCTVPFRGRETQVKSKVGDIVLLWRGDCATPALVTHLPPTRKWWKKHIKGDFGGDFTDDSYTVVEWHHGHDHPNSTCAFPYIGIPTKAIEQKLWSEFKKYVKDCGFPKDCIPMSRKYLKEGWTKN